MLNAAEQIRGKTTQLFLGGLTSRFAMQPISTRTLALLFNNEDRLDRIDTIQRERVEDDRIDTLNAVEFC